MKIYMIATAVAAALSLPHQAVQAAEDLRHHSTTVQQRTGAFAGGSIRLPLGGGPVRRLEARLQIGLARDVRDFRGAGSTQRTALFEIGPARDGSAGVYIGGTETGELKDRLGMSTGTAALIGGGLLVGLLAIAAASAEAPEFDDCFDPQGC
jgi:hypothetical protein